MYKMKRNNGQSHLLIILANVGKVRIVTIRERNTVCFVGMTVDSDLNFEMQLSKLC